MKINHNIAAQMANINLKRGDNRLSTSLEKLSSGYKINKAADDSAGMAISNKMRTQIRALDQANRNAQEGDSVVQTAEGALNEIQSILQRIRELGVQGANDTNTIDDRKAIQSEIDQLLDEVDRISTTTEFNGRSLLNGEASRTIMSNSLSVKGQYASKSVAKGDYEVTVDVIPKSAIMQITVSTDETVSINGVSMDLEPSKGLGTVQETLIHYCDAMNIDVNNLGGGTFELKTRATGADQSLTYVDGSGTTTVEKGEDAEISMGAGFTPATDFSYTSVGGMVVIKGNDGFEMQVDTLKSNAGDTATIRVENAGYMTLQIGANENQTLDVDIREVSCNNLGLRDYDGKNLINVCTFEGASHLLDVMDEALRIVTDIRGQLGAYQNRLGYTESALDESSYDLTDAMSRITDTDMATEMTEYTQNQVIVQAATSMLSQANNRPQTIMSLLQS